MSIEKSSANKDGSRPLPYLDAHCHLDFARNGRLLGDAAACAGLHALSATVTPEGFERARLLFAGCPAVLVGLGLHPWWVADGSCGEAEVARFEELAANARFIGEIGLDFAKRREGTQEAQTAAFERAVHAGVTGGKVVTLHAASAADEVLDVLERFGCTADNACILHWFSGSNDTLMRAARLGCYFSVNPRMLATKRGRAYAKAIPADRLLVETDWPSEVCGDVSFSELADLLRQTVEGLVELRGEGIVARMEQTAREVFDAPLTNA